MKVENTKPIRIEDIDYEELRKLKNFTGIPIVKLIHFAIPLLKKKYKFKEEEKGE